MRDSNLESTKGGAVILLEDQDRSRWDTRLIGVAEHWLKRAGQPNSRFHYEAAIAFCHCRAESVDTTNWPVIVSLYDQLLSHIPSPVYRLNHAIALAQTGDVVRAREELDVLRAEGALTNYFLLDCARARVHELAAERQDAIDCYLAALSRGVADHERTLLEKKISRLAE